MSKPPGVVGAEMQKKFLKAIVLQNSASNKSISEQQRSLSSQPPDESSETFPPLPEHLDKLLNQPWDSDVSRQLDRWLWYVEREFEMVGGLL